MVNQIWTSCHFAGYTPVEMPQYLAEIITSSELCALANYYKEVLTTKTPVFSQCFCESILFKVTLPAHFFGAHVYK